MKINKKIRNILLKRLFITLLILGFIRMGTFLPIPGINNNDLAFYIQSHSVTKNLVSTFSGENLFVIGLFTLNIFPYINASILIQLIIGLYPNLSKLQKEGDLQGRRYIHRLTRIITLIWALIQSIGIALYLRQILFNWNYILAIQIIICLTTGTMIVVWLSELITDYGLGNGTSLLIYTNIILSLPNFYKKILIENTENFRILSVFIIFSVIFASLYGIVFLQKGIRTIPLISSKQLNQSVLQNSSDAYLPLRLNQAGVMPIILTTAALVIPNYISNFIQLPYLNIPINFSFFKFSYWISYFGLILIFSSFYSRIILNPKDLSDQLQKMSVTIPGIRPGIQTTFYLKQVLKRVTVIGAVMLATLTTIPNFIESTLNITGLNGLSASSLLILAGVILDLRREIQNIYYSNIYSSMYN